jgi:hypothetical protein
MTCWVGRADDTGYFEFFKLRHTCKYCRDKYPKLHRAESRKICYLVVDGTSTAKLAPVEPRSLPRLTPMRPDVLSCLTKSALGRYRSTRLGTITVQVHVSRTWKGGKSQY